MPHLVDVKELAPEGHTNASLVSVLRAVEPEAKSLNWTIRDISAAGNLGEDRTYRELQQEAREAPHGLSVSWNELCTLAGRFEDVYDIFLIGNEGIPSLTGSEEILIIYKRSKIVIELFDSGLWRIYAEDEAVINRIAATFRDVKIQDHLLEEGEAQVSDGG